MNESPIRTLENPKRKIKSIKELSSNVQIKTDDLLKLLEKENIKILDSCDKEKITFEKDLHCFKKSLKKEFPLFWSSNCLGCQILTRISNDNVIKTKKLEILTGKEKGEFLKLKRVSSGASYYVENYDFSLIKEKRQEQLNIILRKKNIKKEECFFFTENKDFQISVISSFSKAIFLEKDYPNIFSYLYSFFCQNTLTRLERHKKIKNIEEMSKISFYSNMPSPVSSQKIEKSFLSKKIVKDILKQGVLIFNLFKKENIFHNSPTSEFYSFSKNSSSFKQKEKEYYFSFTINFSFSSLSAIKVKDCYYLYNNNPKLINTGFPLEKIDIDINGSFSLEKTDNIYFKRKIYFFKLSENYDQNVFIFKHSYNFVFFLISLLLNSSYFEVFKSLETDYHFLFKSIWKEEEYDSVIENLEIMRSEKKFSYNDIFEFLKKYYIRVDSLEYFSNYIFNI